MLDFSDMEGETKTVIEDPKIAEMFAVGAHFGYLKSRRHPTVKPYLFGTKNRVEIFDLEKTTSALEAAKAFVASLGAEGKQILFVGGKQEAQKVIIEVAQHLSMPYVAGRWIGGTLTNFSEIKKRIQKLEDLTEKREQGELGKYTKKERLLIDREIEDLTSNFGGLLSLKSMPAALFIVDSKREQIAVREAKDMNIPVVALLNSDCDLALIDYPIPGNDAALPSVSFFVREIAKAYEDGRKSRQS